MIFDTDEVCVGQFSLSSFEVNVGLNLIICWGRVVSETVLYDFLS